MQKRKRACDQWAEAGVMRPQGRVCRSWLSWHGRRSSVLPSLHPRHPCTSLTRPLPSRVCRPAGGDTSAFVSAWHPHGRNNPVRHLQGNAASSISGCLDAVPCSAFHQTCGTGLAPYNPVAPNCQRGLSRSRKASGMSLVRVRSLDALSVRTVHVSLWLSERPHRHHGLCLSCPDPRQAACSSEHPLQTAALSGDRVLAEVNKLK